LPKLDKIIGGIQQSRYYLLSAASSGGKTAMVLYIMYQMLRNMTPDKPVYFCYFSLEIGSEVLLAKLMGLYCAEEFGVYMTINEIMSYESTISLEKFEYLRKAKEWLDTIEPHIKIIDSTLTAKSLYRQFSSFAEEHGNFETIEDRTMYIPNNPKQLLIGIIDHLSLITASEGRKLKEEMDLASSFMVTLKRKLRSS
jgi:replicative DNA helicase